MLLLVVGVPLKCSTYGAEDAGEVNKVLFMGPDLDVDEFFVRDLTAGKDVSSFLNQVVRVRSKLLLPPGVGRLMLLLNDEDKSRCILEFDPNTTSDTVVVSVGTLYTVRQVTQKYDPDRDGYFYRLELALYPDGNSAQFSGPVLRRIVGLSRDKKIDQKTFLGTLCRIVSLAVAPKKSPGAYPEILTSSPIETKPTR